VALDAGTWGVLGQRTVAASDAGTLDALRFVCQLSGQRVWAIEGCRHVSGRIERALVACGERVIRIPPGADDQLQARGTRSGQVRSD
jgi:hypothetical protein